jgi:hypothetical protein
MTSIENKLEDYKKMNQAKNAFLAGVIRGWVCRLKDDKERKDCIDDMLDFSNKIAKSAGVIIANKD